MKSNLPIEKSNIFKSTYIHIAFGFFLFVTSYFYEIYKNDYKEPQIMQATSISYSQYENLTNKKKHTKEKDKKLQTKATEEVINNQNELLSEIIKESLTIKTTKEKRDKTVSKKFEKTKIKKKIQKENIKTQNNKKITKEEENLLTSLIEQAQKETKTEVKSKTLELQTSLTEEEIKDIEYGLFGSIGGVKEQTIASNISSLEILILQIANCWNQFDFSTTDAKNVFITAELEIELDGKIKNVNIEEKLYTTEVEKNTYAQMKESVKKACNYCLMLKGLKKEDYEEWKTIKFNFRQNQEH